MDSKFGTKVRKIIACFLLLCSLSMLLAGCDYTTYPPSITARWKSTDPDFTLEYWKGTSTRPYKSNEYLILNDEQLFIEVIYFPGDFAIVPANSTDMEKVYLRGTWKLSKNELVFHITEDHLFGGIYKEIHFSRENLE
ncbi:MAG: hypothetical protein J1E00_05835 [Oscillospiraceae bacterium]|nr:hypothetical protein [Oscillospiraceae bacterium]